MSVVYFIVTRTLPYIMLLNTILVNFLVQLFVVFLNVTEFLFVCLFFTEVVRLELCVSL